MFTYPEILWVHQVALLSRAGLMSQGSRPGLACAMCPRPLHSPVGWTKHVSGLTRCWREAGACSLFRSRLGSILSRPPHSVGQCKSQCQPRFKAQGNGLCLNRKATQSRTGVEGRVRPLTFRMELLLQTCLMNKRRGSRHWNRDRLIGLRVHKAHILRRYL